MKTPKRTKASLATADPWCNFLGRISDPEDRVLLEEAARCARASAARAAYITVWLACAESLKRKFRDASQFDGAAARIIGEIQQKESQRQAVDTLVLTRAKEYGFISDAEFSQLESVYIQRCLYGHPYEQEPLPDQLLAAAATVTEFVLSQPTKLRHGYLSRQVDLICSDATFLDDHFPAIESYANIVHTRISDDLYLWSMQKLWKKASPIASDPWMAVFLRRVVWFSLAFLRRCSDDFFSEWDAVQDLTRYPFISQVLAAQDLFTKIDKHAQDIVLGNLLAEAETQAASLKAAEGLLTKGVLSARQDARITDAIDNMPLSVIVSSGVHPGLYINKVIDKLRIHNWYEQNPVIDLVRSVGQDTISLLTPEDQRRLGNNVLQAADGNARSAIHFLAEISRAEATWTEDFVEGIVSETLINDENKFRFKIRYAVDAFLCLRAVQSGQRRKIVSRIAKRLADSTPKYQWPVADERARTLEALEEAISRDDKALTVLTTLRDAVASLKVPDEN